MINVTDPATKLTSTRSVVNAEGERSSLLLAVGPILRGKYWETIAVPELRVQARRVAETLLGSARMEADEGQLLLEYMI